MTPVVSLSAVTRRHRSSGSEVIAVDAVSLEVHAGEILGVAGPSGSGKTTLLELLVRWQYPDEGTIVHTDDLLPGWRGIAYVPQGIGLLSELTARENVQLAGGIKLLRVSVADAALDGVGLAELAERHVHEMSMGEQQRAAVARATVVAPTLLVADEPTAHQDEANADRVVAVLRTCADSGSAVVMATHDDRVLAMMDRVLRLRDGRTCPG